jgi:hypothetical protein
MTTTYQTTDIAATSGAAVSFSTSGNSLIVAQGVNISSTASDGILQTATGNAIDNSGEIYGEAAAISDNLFESGTGSNFINEDSGTLLSDSIAFNDQNDPYTIVNYGRIAVLGLTGDAAVLTDLTAQSITLDR